jgi:tetratricopeptide (TPR) repeat protein
MLKKAIALDSNFAAAYTSQSLLFSRLRARGYDYSDSCCQIAKELADRAFELGAGAWEKYRAMGEYHYRCLGAHDSALHYYDLAYKGNRNARGYLYAAHNVLRRMGRFEEAYKNIRRVIELNPKSVVAKFDLSDDCLILGRYAEAEGLLDTVISLEPDFFRAYEQMVMLYLNWQGDIARARQVIERSRGFVDSTRWDTYLVWLDMKERNFQGSLDAIQMPPYDSMYYYYGRTFMHRRMGDSALMRAHAESCVILLEREVENDPGSSYRRGHLGRIYAVLGREEEAILEGLTAIELSPLSDDAVVGYGPVMAMFDIYLFLGDMDRALNYLDTLLSTPGDMGIAHMFVDPDYAPITTHPRFPELVRKHADPEMVDKLLRRL